VHQTVFWVAVSRYSHLVRIVEDACGQRWTEPMVKLHVLAELGYGHEVLLIERDPSRRWRPACDLKQRADEPCR